jgi:hypothetical protein
MDLTGMAGAKFRRSQFSIFSFEFLVEADLALLISIKN